MSESAPISSKATVRKVVQSFGGPQALANLLGAARSTVAMWEINNAIAPRYWPKILALARHKGVKWITAESLITMHHGSIPDLIDDVWVA